jgi:hypothetical protein
MATRKKKATKATAKKREIAYAESDVFQRVYANNVGTALTQWDFCLYFGRIKDATETVLAIENDVAIYMTPEHAFALHGSLGSMLERYEQQFGKIRKGEPSSERELPS